MMPADSTGHSKPWWQRPIGQQSSSSNNKRQRTGSSAAHTGSSTRAAAPRALTQMCLDVGQKGWVRTTCPQCGMTYLPGDPQDEELHARQHAANATCRRFNGWTAERCVSQEVGGARVLLIKAGDAAAHTKKVAELCAFVEQAMGWDAGSIQRQHSDLPPSRTAPGSSQPRPCAAHDTRGSQNNGSQQQQQQVYLLYITADKKVGGMLVADPITRAAISTQQQRQQQHLGPNRQCEQGTETDEQPTTDPVGGIEAKEGSDGLTAFTQPHVQPGGHVNDASASGGGCKQAAVSSHPQPTQHDTHSKLRVCSPAGQKQQQTAPQCKQEASAADAVPTEGHGSHACDPSRPQPVTEQAAPITCNHQQLHASTVTIGSQPMVCSLQQEGTAGTGAGSLRVLKALMGVRAVWVAPNIRRKKVATRLISLARCHMVPGFMVPVTQLAFAAGPLLENEARSFAESYLAVATCMVSGDTAQASCPPRQPSLLVYNL